MCAHGICINMDGSFKCQCQEGYVLSPSGHSCIGNTKSNRIAEITRVTVTPVAFLVRNKMWTNVRKILAFVSTVVARMSPVPSSASAKKAFPRRRSVLSASTWTSAAKRECAITASVSTWTDPSSVSAIPDTSFRLTARLVLVRFHLPLTAFKAYGNNFDSDRLIILSKTLTSASKTLARTEFA